MNPTMEAFKRLAEELAPRQKVEVHATVGLGLRTIMAMALPLNERVLVVASPLLQRVWFDHILHHNPQARVQFTTPQMARKHIEALLENPPSTLIVEFPHGNQTMAALRRLMAVSSRVWVRPRPTSASVWVMPEYEKMFVNEQLEWMYFNKQGVKL